MKTILIFILAILLAVTSFAQVVLDSTFGNNGIVRTAILSDNLVLSGLAFQSDYKIVAAGYTFGYHLKTVRYLPTGVIDISFGTNGITTISNFGVPTDVQVQNDGKIVIAGYTNAPSKNIMARYLVNGTLDSTFGGIGIVQAVVGIPTNNGISEIAFQPDGKIVAGGWAGNQFLVLRLFDNGTLDSTFGTGGMVTTSLLSFSSIWSLALQNDGKIVVAGATSSSYPSSDFAIARYNTNGSLDSTFGVAGKVITNLYSFGDADDFASSLRVQSDNKLIVAGTVGGKCALVRYNINGSLDTSFGLNGVVTDSSILSVVDIALQSDGNILALATGSPIGITRFKSSGIKDINFGNSGTIITDISVGGENAECLELQADGKIVLGGSVKDSSTTPVEGLLIRFNNDVGVGFNEFQTMNNQSVVFPNPANNWLTVSVKKSILGKIKIEAFDLAGKLVLVDNQPLQNEFLQVNVSSIINNGIYLFKLTFPDGTNDVFKVSVNR